MAQVIFGHEVGLTSNIAFCIAKVVWLTDDHHMLGTVDTWNVIFFGPALRSWDLSWHCGQRLLLPELVQGHQGASSLEQLRAVAFKSGRIPGDSTRRVYVCGRMCCLLLWCLWRGVSSCVPSRFALGLDESDDFNANFCLLITQKHCPPMVRYTWSYANYMYIYIYILLCTLHWYIWWVLPLLPLFCHLCTPGPSVVGPCPSLCTADLFGGSAKALSQPGQPLVPLRSSAEMLGRPKNLWQKNMKVIKDTAGFSFYFFLGGARFQNWDLYDRKLFHMVSWHLNLSSWNQGRPGRHTLLPHGFALETTGTAGVMVPNIRGGGCWKLLAIPKLVGLVSHRQRHFLSSNWKPSEPRWKKHPISWPTDKREIIRLPFSGGSNMFQRYDWKESWSLTGLGGVWIIGVVRWANGCCRWF